MKLRKKMALLAAAASVGILASGAANASLSLLQQFVGDYGLSTNGFGSVTQNGNITANVPVGSTVVAAYLYSSLYNTETPATTLNGNTLSFTALGANQSSLQASRANVTSIVAPVVNGGPGGNYSFAVHETTASTDGEALVVVYFNAALSTSTVAILDGFSSSAGDNSSISFSTPLNPSSSGFQAEMRIGDGYSCCNQASTITVNGSTLTTVAGNNDDSVDGGSPQNGSLITVGGDNDPFTVASPGSPATDYTADHERYNLVPFINNGDTTISLHTVNPSGDDNIFLETFLVSGNGNVVSNGPPSTGPNGVPEPATWAMMIIGLGGIGASLRRRRPLGVATA